VVVLDGRGKNIKQRGIVASGSLRSPRAKAKIVSLQI